MCFKRRTLKAAGTVPPTSPEKIIEEMEKHYRDNVSPHFNGREWDVLTKKFNSALRVYRDKEPHMTRDAIKSLWNDLYVRRGWTHISTIKVKKFYGQYPCEANQRIDNDTEPWALRETAYAKMRIQFEKGKAAESHEVEFMVVFEHQQDCTWFPVFEIWEF